MMARRIASLATSPVTVAMPAAAARNRSRSLRCASELRSDDVETRAVGAHWRYVVMP